MDKCSRDPSTKVNRIGVALSLLIIFFSFHNLSLAASTSKLTCSQDHPDWTLIRPPGFSASTTYMTNRPSMAFITMAGPSNANKIFGHSLAIFFMKKSLNAYNEKNIELFGLPAFSFEYDMAKGFGINMHMRAFIIFDGGKYFSITFGALKSEFSDEQPLFDNFLNTCDIQFQ